MPAYACDSNPGDVVAFDVRCWHASHGGATGRRMCTSVYYNNPKGPAQEKATRKRGSDSKEVTAHFGRPGQSAYPDEWLANPEGSPKRQRWLERMAELGYFELPATT